LARSSLVLKSRERSLRIADPAGRPLQVCGVKQVRLVTHWPATLERR
jgi:hypothetical protein